MEIILASASESRKKLLTKLTKSLNFNFTIKVSTIDEIHDQKMTVEDLTCLNATLKAVDIEIDHPNHLILGADTLVSIKNKKIGKPSNMQEAKEMLMELSGKWHQVTTGICLTNRKKLIFTTKATTSSIFIKKLNEEQITNYHKYFNPLEKAGAYDTMHKKEQIIKEIQGSENNVAGLPSEELKIILKPYLN